MALVGADTLVTTMGSLKRLSVLVALGAMLAAALSSAGVKLVSLILVAACCLFAKSRRTDPKALSLSCAAIGGILLPLVPWAGDEVLLALSLAYMIVEFSRPVDVQIKHTWAAPLLAYGAGSTIAELALALDFLGFGETSFLRGVAVDGVARVVDVWRTVCENQVHSIRWCARIVVVVAAVDFFASAPERRERFLQGLLAGSGFSALFASAQWLSLLPFTLDNQTAFWTSLRRISGLATDPNALGLVMALSLWGLAWRVFEFKLPITAAHIVYIALVLGAGFVSGSRTFLLGITILGLVMLWHYAMRLFIVTLCAGGVSILSVTALDVYTSFITALQQSVGLPEGLRRGITSLSLIRVSETFGSRSLFVQIASEVGKGHILFGVGPSRFSDYVPLVGVRSGIVRGWTDNANNLYLGIVGELGLSGLLLCLHSVLLRTRTVLGQSSLGTGILFGLALIMLTGPHIDFPEVALLTAFFVGATTLPRVMSPIRFNLVVGLALLLGLCAAANREQGVFPWDDNERAALRWLSNRARVELICEEQEGGRRPHLSMRLHPSYIPQSAPLSVDIWKDGQRIRQLSFPSHTGMDVSLACDNPGTRKLVTIVTRPPWSPYRAWPESSGDRRLLGVEQVVRRK